MKHQSLGYYLKIIFLTVIIAASSTTTIFALSASSENYQLTESQFNAGGTLNSCSGQYCARASIGDMVSGRSESVATTAEFGPITSEEPMLEVIVDPGESNLGILNTEQAATKTTTVRIRNYLSGGYILYIVGDPPKYEDHTLATPSTPTESRPGTEQFAINAVANTMPNVGADPVQVPSAQTSFGTVAEDYRTPNLFKYASNEVVAQSDSESGRTDYTISMIVNISNNTPAGHYTGEFSAVVIPIY